MSSPVPIKKGRGLKRKLSSEKKSSSPSPAPTLRQVFVYRKGDDEITWGVAKDVTDDNTATMENGDIVTSGQVIKAFSQSFQKHIACYIDDHDRDFHPKRLLTAHTYIVSGSRGKLPAEARQACLEAIHHCREHPIKLRGRGNSRTQLELEIASLKRQLEREKGSN